jgi:hypothetical protein
MTGREMLDDLAVRIYEEPLCHIRNGAALDQFATEVCAIADSLYADRGSQDSPFLRLQLYLEERAGEIQSELSRLGG